MSMSERAASTPVAAQAQTGNETHGGLAVNRTRVCRRCRDVCPASEFLPNARSADGLGWQCADCRAQAADTAAAGAGIQAAKGHTPVLRRREPAPGGGWWHYDLLPDGREHRSGPWRYSGGEE